MGQNRRKKAEVPPCRRSGSNIMPGEATATAHSSYRSPLEHEFATHAHPAWSVTVESPTRATRILWPVGAAPTSVPRHASCDSRNVNMIVTDAILEWAIKFLFISEA